MSRAPLTARELAPTIGDRVRVVEIGTRPAHGDLILPHGSVIEMVLPADAEFDSWPDWFRLPIKVASEYGRGLCTLWTQPVRVEILERRGE